jgi:ABC-type multidrug transport system fused ATPase/permease subunit
MDQSYAVFLLIGVVLVVVDGQLIYFSGRGYLSKAYGNAESARSMNRLVAVLFHLVVLGLLMLISTIDVDTGDPVQDVIFRLGIVLLLLALAHGATMAVLARIRDRQLQQALVDEMAEEHRQFDERHRGIPESRVESSQAVETRSTEKPYSSR